VSENAMAALRIAASWQTQFRIAQAIGRALSELKPLQVTVSVGGSGAQGLQTGAADLAFTKSINNEHRYTGKGIYASAQPETWLRTIAWLPQEDRFLFALAPWLGIDSFEQLAERRPALNMAAQRSVEPVLREYGFSFADMERWGCVIGSMHHTAHAAEERSARGELDACFGDGSEYDGTAWRWMAARGYRFLGIRPDVMDALERNYGLRRNVTPVGYLPGISENLIALDDSHIVVTCHERLDEELAYLLAKAIDEHKREIECNTIQVGYAQHAGLPLTEPSLWSSMTTPIERQWDRKVLGAPLHSGAERYYREKAVL
jgi:TRAP-type uncharacterized transport system substrate-binding protein